MTRKRDTDGLERTHGTARCTPSFPSLIANIFPFDFQSFQTHLFMLHRQDIRTIEVTFIRGGQRSSSQAERNGSPLAASALPNSGPVYAGNEVDPRLPSAAAQPDLSDSEIFMQQLLAAPGDTSIASAANFVNPQSQGSPTAMNFVSPDGSPRHQASPPVIVPSLLPAEAVSQVQNLEAAPPLVGYASSQPIGTGYPDHVATALPQGMLGGFQPASYSTPLVPGGAYPAQPGTVHMNGTLWVVQMQSVGFYMTCQPHSHPDRAGRTESRLSDYRCSSFNIEIKVKEMKCNRRWKSKVENYVLFEIGSWRPMKNSWAPVYRGWLSKAETYIYDF